MDTTSHRMRHLALVAAAAAIGLAWCGGSGTTETAAESPTPSETTTTTTAAPTPTATEATPEQVASVIAGYESRWRETIDGAGDCRFLRTMADGPADELNVITCYTNEVIMGTSAQNAIRELEALEVPASMTSLVDETTRALQNVADVDMEAVCGPAMTRPNESEECRTAFGTRFMFYGLLESVLDKWRPYL